MQKLKAIDLFAGIGGVKLGLEQAGIDVIFSNDIDKYCKLTFDTNFPRDILDNRDIKTIDSTDIPDHDILAAGFPCQPFSMAGKQRGFEDPRGSLFYQVVRIINDKRPAAFILENVRNLVSHNKGETFKTILHELEENLGYKVHYKILNSKHFGLPQRRERVYIVGFKEDIPFSFPEESEPSAKISDILEDNVEDFYFLSQKYYEGLAKHKERHREKGSGFGFEILEPNGLSHALVVGNMGRERNLIKDQPRTGFYSEGMDKAVTKNSSGVRKLTIRECARLQGFPEDFEFPVTKTQAYKQLGNAVSVPVVFKVAEKVKLSLESFRNEARDLNIPSAYLAPSLTSSST